MAKLDFLVIGAQKSGTTTLFQLLSEHPQVFVPAGKELPFFNKGDVSATSYRRFMAENYPQETGGVMLGKVTPHYLTDPNAHSLIAEFAPDAKLIVILRDPVRRAFSHYRMSYRRELDKRSFLQAVEDCLQPAELDAARHLPASRSSENRTYVAWGEYGRLLSNFENHIANGNLLVLSMRELEENPKRVMARICDYLGIEEADLPSLGQKLHQGGDREKLPMQKMVRKIGPIKWLWRQIPRSLRTRILFRFEQWNVVRSEHDGFPQADPIVARLTEHFEKDANTLEAVTGWRADWR